MRYALLSLILKKGVPGEKVNDMKRAFERIKGTPHGHGDQRVLPDDCQFGDNDLCYADA